MDIIAYQKDRDTELSNFKKEYSDLIVEYRQYLTEAIEETDPEKQGDLIQKVLATNAQISNTIKEFIGSSKEFDTKTISELTTDIVNYQKQYANIQSSKNKLQAVQTTLNQVINNSSGLRLEFNIFLGILAFAILVVIILIVRTSTIQFPAAPTLPTVGIGSS
jgi:hypothetical protein